MFGVRKSTERKFLKGLRGLFQGLLNRISGKNSPPEGVQEYIREFQFSTAMEKRLNQIIATMVKAERVDSANSWREAALLGSNSREMYQGIKHEMDGPVGARAMQIVNDNAQYIKTVPESWADYIVSYTQRETMKGKRPEEIEAELRKIMPEHITKNLKTIARTECSKANAALVEARADSLGIKSYIWRSAKDERTRHAHAAMDGVLVFFNDPPNPEALFGGGKPYGSYHAGNTFNCRCYMEPVVDIRFLPDSIRVHDSGSVQVMTRNQIRKRFGKIA